MVKKILRKRKLKINTKVIQQTRVLFNKDLQKTIKTFQKGKKSDNGMLRFKSSKSFNNQGFETTKEQYSLIDYINPITKEISKTISITYSNNKFYIYFNIERNIKEKRTKYSKEFHKNNGVIKKINKNNKTKLKTFAIDMNINNLDIGNYNFYKTQNRINKIFTKNTNQY